MCIGMFLGVKIPRNSPKCTCTIYSTSAPVFMSKPILKLGVQLYGMLIVTTNEKCKLVKKEISFRIWGYEMFLIRGHP